MEANLVDMKQEPKKGDMMPHAMEGETPEYPYGLCIHLAKEQIDALNLSEMPEPGEAFKILAMGVVTRSSMEPGGKNPELAIQITALQLVPEEVEEDEEESGEKSEAKKPPTILGNSYRGAY